MIILSPNLMKRGCESIQPISNWSSITLWTPRCHYLWETRKNRDENIVLEFYNQNSQLIDRGQGGEMRKTKACEGHLTKRGTEWVFSFDEGTRYGQFSSWMTSLISFCLFIFKENRFARRPSPICTERQVMRCTLCIVNCARQVMR